MHRFLPSVIEYSQDVADIIVADNASTDNSLQLLRDEFPSVQTIVLDKNYGFAEGYNRALKQVDNEYYMLANLSCVPSILVICLNMLVPVVVILIVMAIHSVVVAYLIQ